MVKKKKRKSNDPVFWTIFKRFREHAEGLEKSLVLVDAMNELLRVEAKKVRDFIDKKAENVKRKDGLTTFSVSPKNVNEYRELVRQRNNTKAACRVLPQSLFVSAISQFDVLMGSLVKTILDTQPNIISPDKQLTFADIKGFKTIKEAVEHLIEKEIESLLFESHATHLSWLGKRTGIDFSTKLSKDIPKLVELTERRNLFVHTDGVINSRYLNQCKEAGFSVPKEHKKGFELATSPQYFKESIEILYTVSAKLTFLLWRKYKITEINKAEEIFNDDIAIHLIKRNKFSLATKMLQFAETEFIGGSEEMKRVMFINLALALRLDGKKQDSITTIESKDWSACSNDLKLGAALIKDDYTEALRLMEVIGKESRFISESGYMDSPIFIDLRQHKDFPRVFKKIYGKNPVSKKEEKEPASSVKKVSSRRGKKNLRGK